MVSLSLIARCRFNSGPLVSQTTQVTFNGFNWNYANLSEALTINIEKPLVNFDTIIVARCRHPLKSNYAKLK